MTVEGFKILGKNKGKFGILSKAEQNLQEFNFAGGTVFAKNKEEALFKLRKMYEHKKDSRVYKN